MKTIRIAAGMGFYGDAWQPVLPAIERAGAQYVCSDHLAELTLSILHKDRLRDPSLGYARDLLALIGGLWPAASQRGVRFVLNAGGLNPEGARQALAVLFAARGWKARVAAVTGDAVLGRIDELQAAGASLAHMDTGRAIDEVRERLVFANVYLGARPIAHALAQGADIVITGRVADAALFLGPMLHEFGWRADEHDRIAQGIVAGHLLECSGQGSGGNFGSASAWQGMPDLTHIGYPIAEVGEDGSLLITKAPGTGGRIDFHTVRQQLLYEVHDPRCYITPDGVLDMGELRLEDAGPDAVRVRHARGHAAPARLKMVAGYTDGWMGHSVVGFSWPDALAKARSLEASIRTLVAERRMAHEELIAEHIGHDTFLGPHADRGHEAHLNEVWLRMAIRSADKRVAEAFPRLFPWLALSGPPFMGGFHGIPAPSQLTGLWPALLPRELVEPGVRIDLQDIG